MAALGIGLVIGLAMARSLQPTTTPPRSAETVTPADPAGFTAACQHAALLLHYRELIGTAAGVSGSAKVVRTTGLQRREMGQILSLLGVLRGPELDRAWQLWQESSAEARHQLRTLALQLGGFQGESLPTCHG